MYYARIFVWELTNTGSSSATSPLLPSSTKIDDVYTRHAAIESPPGHWLLGPALEAAIGSFSRQLITLYLRRTGNVSVSDGYIYYTVLGENIGTNLL